MNLTVNQMDVLTEIFNIGVGKGAEVLNTMLHSHIVLNVPSLELLEADKLPETLAKLCDEEIAAVDLPFRGDFVGKAELFFPASAAAALVSALIGEEKDTEELDAIRAGTLSEIGNIVLGALMGTISNMLKLNFSYSVPEYFEGDIESVWRSKTTNGLATVLLARTRMQIQDMEIDATILVFLEVGSLDLLSNSLDRLLA